MPLQIIASDSVPGQTLTYAATGLPNGLSINSSSGIISGTPTATGTYSVVVTVTDSLGAAGSVGFSWFITGGGGNVVTVTNPGNQTNTVGQSPTLQIVASDSATGQTLTYTATGLPNGLTINSSTGFISGTLTTAGSFSVTVHAVDTTGATGQALFTWTVNSQPTVLQARVGNSIPNKSFDTGCYNSGFGPIGANQNQEGADTFFVQNVNRPVGGTHLKVTKKFWNGGPNPGDNGDYHLSNNYNNMQNYQKHGTRVIACIQPACPPGLLARDPGSNTPCNFTTSSQCTSAQKTTCLNEVQNIINFCKALKNMGFTSQTLRIVLYQEPANAGRNGQTNGVKMTPIDYGNVWRTYGPVIQTNSQCFGADGLPFPLISNTNFVGGGAVSNTTDYANAALGRNPTGNANPPTGVTLLGLAVDFYTNSYYKSPTNLTINKTLSTLDANGESLLTIADAVGIGFGFHEFGDVPLRYDPGGAPWTNSLGYLNYVKGVMTARISANKPNLDCIYYQSQCAADGTADIASPIAQDPGTGSLIGSSPANHYNDFRIAWFQGFYDAVNGN